MKTFFALAILVTLSLTAKSQGLYKGGKGGGWASARYQRQGAFNRQLPVFSGEGQYKATIKGLSSNGMVTLRLYDRTGRLMERRILPMDATSYRIGQNLAKGIYLLVAESEGRQTALKVAV